MKKTQETWVQSLSWEDPLENYNSFQQSCLENPMDRGAQQAAVYGVIKESDTTEDARTINISN